MDERRQNCPEAWLCENTGLEESPAQQLHMDEQTEHSRLSEFDGQGRKNGDHAWKGHVSESCWQYPASIYADRPQQCQEQDDQR